MKQENSYCVLYYLTMRKNKFITQFTTHLCYNKWVINL